MTNAASRTDRRRAFRAPAVAILAVGAMTLVGCSNAGEGAVSGTLLGAGSGAAIGSLTGSAGKGAIIGAIAGGLGGAILGDQNEKNDRRARQADYDRRYHDNRYDEYRSRTEYREYRDDRPPAGSYQAPPPEDDGYYTEREYERTYERRYERPR